MTGFDAPQLNTLYVDRTLKGASLIQAYSRTNRVYDNQTKTFGHIVSFRWPSNSKRLMDEALAKYANSASANVQTGLFDEGDDGSGDGILANDYKNVVNELKKSLNISKKETLRTILLAFLPTVIKMHRIEWQATCVNIRDF